MPASAGVVQEAGKPLRPLDLDQAQAAGAEGLQAVGGAQLGHLDAGVHRGAHQRGACGTVTLSPSISSVTSFRLALGVP
jgi:hypothetical protein